MFPFSFLKELLKFRKKVTVGGRRSPDGQRCFRMVVGTSPKNQSTYTIGYKIKVSTRASRNLCKTNYNLPPCSSGLNYELLI
jgi:hypothetical protein